MSTEDLKFVRKVSQILDEGSDKLDRKIAIRLQESRQKALSHHRVAVGGLRFAGLGHMGTFGFPTFARTLVAAFALMAGVIFTYYWNSFEQAAENAEVDSALLSDELPPAAYLDKGFQAWLEHSSPSSR
ncbi:MAG: DUF3619 family protein [Ignavibacteria bacterium]